MIILDVQPKEIHAVIDLSFTEIEHLLNVLEHSEVSTKCPGESMAFVKKVLVPKLDELTGGKE